METLAGIGAAAVALLFVLTVYLLFAQGQQARLLIEIRDQLARSD